MAVDTTTAIQRLGETARIGRRAGDVLVTTLVICQIAEQRMLQGRRHQAAEVYRQLLLVKRRIKLQQVF